jgi:hypothetical protein
MTAKHMNSHLKQAHTKEVEKIGVNSYKVLLNFNDSAWNINKHCAYILKNRLSLSCSKLRLRAKLRKLKNFSACVSSFQESLFVCNPEPKLGHFDKLFPFKCSF